MAASGLVVSAVSRMPLMLAAQARCGARRGVEVLGALGWGRICGSRQMSTDTDVLEEPVISKRMHFFSTLDSTSQGNNLTDLVRASLPKLTRNQIGLVPGGVDILERDVTTTALKQMFESPEKVKQVALRGKPGTGKSVGMARVLAQCHEAGWIVAHVPNAASWSDELQTIETSLWKSDRIDQPTASTEWLRYFVKWNEHILQDLPIIGTYGWDAMSASPPDTVLALANMGIDDSGYRIATDVVGIVLKEIAKPEVAAPMVLAIDSYNAWQKDIFPKFKDFDAVKVVTMERAALVRHFWRLATKQDGIASGAIVVAESDNFGSIPFVDFQSFDNAHFADFTRYTGDELSAILDNCVSRGLISRIPKATTLPVIEHMTSSNPREVFKFIATL